MPRPRKASDDEIFGAAVRVMSRVGPAELTLSEIAREAGLTAGALVQRFGGKKELLHQMASQLAGSTEDAMAALRARNPWALGALRAYARGWARMAESPEALARNLAYLQLDLTDPDLYESLAKQARATRKAFEKLLAEAVDAGELPAGTDVPALARAVEVLLSGALMTWAVHREGKADRFLLRELDGLLALAGRKAP